MKSANTILKLADLFEDEVKKYAAKWKKMPPGWKAKSRKSFFKNLADESVGECMKRMEDHIDDPGAFCASLKDRVKKTTNWREGRPENLKKKKKKKANASVLNESIQAYMLGMFQLNGGLYYGMTPMAKPDYKMSIGQIEDCYGIKIIASLSGRNGYSNGDILIPGLRSKAFVSDDVKANSRKSKDLYKKGLTQSLESMLNETFEGDFVVDIEVI